MSDDCGGEIVKNIVELTGNKDYVDDAIKALKNKEGYVDFNCIVPVENNEGDIRMNDYINASLNVWLNQHKDVDREKFISTMHFVGITREYVYMFKELSKEELNIYKTKNQVLKMLKDAKEFIKCVKGKGIFDGYFARNGAWGTGTQPINLKIKGNRLDFNTFNTPALKLFKKLSIMFPDIKVVYTYEYEYRDDNNRIKKDINIVTYRNGEEKIQREDRKESVSSFNTIRENVAI